MSRTLILIPTQPEFDVLQPRLASVIGFGDSIELCGFGLVAAAARAAQLIAHRNPDRVLLIGIAGTFTTNLAVGSATTFREVTCCGIGAGTGADHVAAAELGWHQFCGPLTAGEPDATEVAVSDTIVLPGLGGSSGVVRSERLLSLAAASASPEEAACRRQKFPDAMAEDMEGFGVALACEMAGVPLEIIRGISNRVGDRDRNHWRVEPAMQAAAELAIDLLR